MPQPRQTAASRRRAERRGAAAGGVAGAAAAVGPAGAAASAAGVAATTEVATAAVLRRYVQAILAAITRLAKFREDEIRAELGARNVPTPEIDAVLKREQERETLFRERTRRRAEAQMRVALAAPDAESRAAAVQAVINRERRFARQRVDAQVVRIEHAAERERLKRESPLGALWLLGPAREHTPECVAMANKVWPWVVLDQLPLPLHTGCRCRLVSIGDATERALINPATIMSRADAIRRAAPIIQLVRDEQEEERRRVLQEAEVRLELLELGGDPLHLALAPYAVELAESKGDTSKSAMVALYPPPEVAQQLAVAGGESIEELHLTLAFLGPDIAKLDREGAEAAVREWAAQVPPIKGEVSGTGYFINGPDPVTYASVDAPTLPSAREVLVGGLEAAGVEPAKNHGFTPHITLAYANKRPAITEAIPVEFDRVVLAWGEEHLSIPLGGGGGGKGGDGTKLGEGEMEEREVWVEPYTRDGARVGGYWRVVSALGDLTNPRSPTQSIRTRGRRTITKGKGPDTFDVTDAEGRTETIKGRAAVAKRLGATEAPEPQLAEFETPQSRALKDVAVEADREFREAVDAFKQEVLRDDEDDFDMKTGKQSLHIWGSPRANATDPNDPEQFEITNERRERLHARTIDAALSGLERPEGRKPKAILMVGGPAGGKGRVKTSDELGLDISKWANADPDEVGKETNPEYRGLVGEKRKDASQRVHEESSILAEAMLNVALEEGLDTIVDKVGASDGWFRLVDQLQREGRYDMEMHVVTKDIDEAWEGAVRRYDNSGRWVPREVLVKGHRRVAAQWDNLAALGIPTKLWDRTGVQGGAGKLIAEVRQDGSVFIHDEEMFARYRERANYEL